MSRFTPEPLKRICSRSGRARSASTFFSFLQLMRFILFKFLHPSRPRRVSSSVEPFRSWLSNSVILLRPEIFLNFELPFEGPGSIFYNCVRPEKISRFLNCVSFIISFESPFMLFSPFASFSLLHPDKSISIMLISLIPSKASMFSSLDSHVSFLT